MAYHNEAPAIAQQWQQQIEESLEAGESLWLELGVSQRVVDQVEALAALRTVADRRVDVTTPGLVVGGDGAMWAAACLSAAVGAAAKPAPGMMLLYGGADRATYMATLATLSTAGVQSQQRRLTGLPIGVHAWLWPDRHPGGAPRWAALPFVLPAPKPPAADHAPNDPAMWFSWLALVVVIGLVITALFV